MSPVKQRVSTAGTQRPKANINKTGGYIAATSSATIDYDAERQALASSPVRTNIRARINASPTKLGTNANMFHN